MLDQLTAADFETLPDHRIEAQFGDTTVSLEIIEVRLLGPNPARRLPAFALTLRDNGADYYAPQGIYVYRHPQHGPLELFTVPAGPDGTGMRYEISFN